MLFSLSSIAKVTPSCRGTINGGDFRVHSDLEMLREKVVAWSNEGLESTVPGPFSSWDWYLSWLECFPGAYDEIVFFEVSLLRAEHSGARCVFPMIRKGSSLELAGYDIGDFQGAMCNRHDLLRNFVDILIRFSQEHQYVISFSKLSDHGSLKYELIRGAERIQAPLVIPHFGPCPYFSIEGEGMDDVLSRLGKSTRKGIRRRIRKFEAEFGKDFQIESGISRELLAIASELHQKLQCHKPGESIFGESGVLDFLQAIADSPGVGMTASLLRSRDGRAIAFEIGYLVEDTYYAWVAAYDPDLSDYRPGTCAMAYLIDHLAKRGVKTFDFLCGAEKYKYQYAKDEHQIHGVKVFPKNGLNRFYTRCWRLREVAKAEIKALAIRAGIYTPNYRV